MLSVNIFPTDIDDIKINKEDAVKVYKLLKEMDTHLLLYGSKGSGKKTLLQCAFNTLFPCDKISECPIKEYESQMCPDTIPMKTNSRYVEINCNLIRNQSRNSIMDILKDICKNYVFGTDGQIHKRYIIIHDIDILNVSIQLSLRRIMEIYTDTVVFVLTTSYLNKIIDAFKSRCVCLRIAPPVDDIANQMKKLGISKRTTQSKLKKNENMLTAFLDLDGIQSNEQSYILISDFIKGKKTHTPTDVKQTLHNLMSTNVNYETIMKNILKSLKCEKMKIEKVVLIHETASTADIMCINGSKIVICLEYFIFRLRNIMSNSTLK